MSYTEMDVYKTPVKLYRTASFCLCSYLRSSLRPSWHHYSLFKHGSYLVVSGCVTKHLLRQDFQIQSLPLHGAVRTHVLVQT